MEKNVLDYLVKLELLSFKKVSLSLLRKQKNALMKQLPDEHEARRNENAEISEAYLFLKTNLIEANRKLQENIPLKEAEKERLYNLTLFGGSLPTCAELKEALKVLKRISPYRESSKLIKKYSVLMKKRQTFEKYERREKNKVLSQCIVFTTLCLSVLSGIYTNKTIESHDAADLIESGDFEAAKKLLEENPTYANNPRLLKVIECADLLVSKDFESAISDFTEIDGTVYLTYKTNGGLNDSRNPTIIRKGQIFDPMKPGYIEGRWLLDNFSFELSSEFVLNLILEASYSGLVTYFISYFLYGGINNQLNPISYDVNDQNELKSPSKTGHSFQGWYQSSDFSGIPITSIVRGTTGNLTLHAKWTANTYSIFFVENGGSSVENITQIYGTIVTQPSVPTRNGYSFGGWYIDPQCQISYTFSTMPAEFLTLYAKWFANLYTIFFEENGGTQVADITQDYGTVVVSPPYPTRQYYFFDGWFTDVQLTKRYTFTTIPADNITLYARWRFIRFPPASSLQSRSFILSGTECFAWGENDYGQLGDGTTVNRKLPTNISSQFDLTDGERIIDLGTGLYNSVALSNTGRVFFWDSHEINPRDITTSFPLVQGDKIVEVTAGSYYYYFAISLTGRVFSWGLNSYGQLGQGSTTRNHTPTDITAKFNLSAGDRIFQISSGDCFAFALSKNGRVFSWGSNEYGQLGDGTKTIRLIPTEITPRFSLPSGDRISNVSGGRYFAVGNSNLGRVFRWGNSTTIPTEITSVFVLKSDDYINNILAGGYGAIAISQGGNVFTIGSMNLFSEEVTPFFTLVSQDKMVFISAGEYHFLAVSEMGRIYTWGSNSHGQLGDGTTINQTNPREITSFFSF